MGSLTSLYPVVGTANCSTERGVWYTSPVWCTFSEDEKVNAAVCECESCFLLIVVC